MRSNEADIPSDVLSATEVVLVGFYKTVEQQHYVESASTDGLYNQLSVPDVALPCDCGKGRNNVLAHPNQ